MPEPSAYIQQTIIWKCFWNSIKEQKLQQYCKDLAETKFKNKRLYLYGETGVGKTKLVERNSKSARKDIYKHW